MVNILIVANIMFFIKPKTLRIKLLQKRLKFSFFRACRTNFCSASLSLRIVSGLFFWIAGYLTSENRKKDR